MVSGFVQGIIQGASSQYVKNSEQDRELKQKADTKALERANSLKDSKDLLRYKSDMAREEQELKRKASQEELSQILSGGLLAGQASEIDTSDPNVQVGIQYWKEGKKAKAMENFAKSGDIVTKLQTAKTNLSNAQMTNVTKKADQAVKDVTLRFQGDQPIEVYDRLLQNNTGGVNPVADYGRGYEAETVNRFKSITKELGEKSRIPDSGETSLDGTQVATNTAKLLRTINDMIYNPNKTEADKKVFKKAVRSFMAVDREIDEMVGGQFDSTKYLPREFVNKMMNSDVTSKVITETSGTDKAGEQTVSNDGNYSIGHISYINGSKAVIVGFDPDDGEALWEFVE